VALARALTTEPELLVLDEPVCALDQPTRYEVCHNLRKAQKAFGVATLHVCHSLEEAKLVSDRIGIMDAGQLIATGTFQELSDRKQPESVRKLFAGTNEDKRERRKV
jgi:ABC-type sulfate/molybdate transport systems ATPase subunit